MVKQNVECSASVTESNRQLVHQADEELYIYIYLMNCLECFNVKFVNKVLSSITNYSDSRRKSYLNFFSDFIRNFKQFTL